MDIQAFQKKKKKHPFGNFNQFGFGGFGDSSDEDDFFGGDFGFGGSNNFGGSSYTSSSFGGGGASKSVTKKTIIKNGQKVTKQVTEIIRPDGTVKRYENKEQAPAQIGYGKKNKSRKKLGYYN